MHIPCHQPNRLNDFGGDDDDTRGWTHHHPDQSDWIQIPFLMLSSENESRVNCKQGMWTGHTPVLRLNQPDLLPKKQHNRVEWYVTRMQQQLVWGKRLGVPNKNHSFHHSHFPSIYLFLLHTKWTLNISRLLFPIMAENGADCWAN